MPLEMPSWSRCRVSVVTDSNDKAEQSSVKSAGSTPAGGRTVMVMSHVMASLLRSRHVTAVSSESVAPASGTPMPLPGIAGLHRTAPAELTTAKSSAIIVASRPRAMTSAAETVASMHTSGPGVGAGGGGSGGGGPACAS